MSVLQFLPEWLKGHFEAIDWLINWLISWTLISLVADVIHVYLKEAVLFLSRLRCFNSLCSVSTVIYTQCMCVSVGLKCVCNCVWPSEYLMHLREHMNEQHITTPISNCHGRTAEKQPPHLLLLRLPPSLIPMWMTHMVQQLIYCTALCR